MKVRRTAVADRFYPADPDDLASLIDGYLDCGSLGGPTPKALVVPHAGYVFSGAVAGSGYAQLTPAAAQIEKVLLLGPAHTVGFDGLSVSAADYWESPLGRVAVDTELRDRVGGLPGVRVEDRAHATEHCLEVQLPFLQRLLDPGFTILPIVIGWADPPTVAEILEAVWGGAETAVVISSDLSHYHDYSTAQRLDRATAAEIVACRGDTIGPDQACGAFAIAGLLERKLVGRTIELCNSGDTAGDKQRVVGYGAFAFAEA